MTNSISLNILSPCKGCADRVLHCHSTCKRYSEYKERLEAKRAENASQLDEIKFVHAVKSEVRKRYNMRRPKDKHC